MLLKSSFQNSLAKKEASGLCTVNTNRILIPNCTLHGFKKNYNVFFILFECFSLHQYVSLKSFVFSSLSLLIIDGIGLRCLIKNPKLPIELCNGDTNWFENDIEIIGFYWKRKFIGNINSTIYGKHICLSYFFRTEFFQSYWGS